MNLGHSKGEIGEVLSFCVGWVEMDCIGYGFKILIQ